MSFDAQPALHTATRRRVNETLRGPVVTILRGLAPGLRGVSQGAGFEAILGDWQLLQDCFALFRAHRVRFAHLLVDGARRCVGDDDQPLACGRSVNQVIAMVVRSAAKRHFRQRLDWNGGGARRAGRPAAGSQGMLDWARGRTADQAARARGEESGADRLYREIRQYLLYEWQTPIIPQYARMTPPEVRELGPRLLEFRTADELSAYLDSGGRWPEPKADAGGHQASPAAMAPEPVPAAQTPAVRPLVAEPVSASDDLASKVEGTARLPSASLTRPDGRARISEVLSADGRSLRMEVVGPVLIGPAIQAALGWPAKDDLLRAGRELGKTGGATVRRLVVDAGLGTDQMVALLAQAALMLPAQTYQRLFGRQGDVALILALLRRAEAAGAGAHSTPAELAAFVRAVFGRFRP